MRLSRLRPALAGLCLLPALAGAAGQPARTKLVARLGVVVRHGDALCAYLNAPAPTLGSRLAVVVPEASQTMAAASLDGRDDSCHDDVSPRLPAFRLDLLSGTIPPLVASIAILGPAPLAPAGGRYEWRDAAAAPVTFSSCTSAEGVHLGAWQGGHRVWHAYLYLGQDLAADCTQAQARP